MRIHEIISESKSTPVAELKQGLLDLPQDLHTYKGIDTLMQHIAKKHKISADELHDAWVAKYKKTPDDWIKSQSELKEYDMVLDRDEERDLHNNPLIAAARKTIMNHLKLQNEPQIEFSHDTAMARKGHHTGRFTPDDNGGTIWIYCRNRNLVDIIRTLAHELCHCKQREDGRIKPDSARPGSDIEREADEFAGIFVKLFGKKHREIFESRR